MKTIFAVIGFVVVALVLGTCVACNDDDDDTLGKVVLISHNRDGDEGDCDWNGDCGDDSYRNEYGRGKNGDQGSAGRDQCHSFCNNIIIIPDPTKDQEPQS